MDTNKLLVGGVVSLTTVDYPDHLSAVVFLQGCPWRCVYCHNPHLQTISQEESLPWEDVLNLLETRKGFIEAVVFSGGEPLFQEALFSAIVDVKKLGLKAGLHTSGAYPDRFAKVVSFLDWVGFDVKQAFKDYHLITSVNGSGEDARESLRILLESNVDYEVRITMHESIQVETTVEMLRELCLMGVRNVVLQKCRDKNENVVEHPIFSDKILLENVYKDFDSFYIRG